MQDTFVHEIQQCTHETNTVTGDRIWHEDTAGLHRPTGCLLQYVIKVLIQLSFLLNDIIVNITQEAMTAYASHVWTRLDGSQTN